MASRAATAGSAALGTAVVCIGIGVYGKSPISRTRLMSDLLAPRRGTRPQACLVPRQATFAWLRNRTLKRQQRSLPPATGQRLLEAALAVARQKELSGQAGHRVRLFVECEMAAIDNVDFGAGHVAPVRFGVCDQERRVEATLSTRSGGWWRYRNGSACAASRSAAVAHPAGSAPAGTSVSVR
jgi:hypothetical protein